MGNLREAGRFYRSVLKRNPQQPEALHMLGVLAAQTGNLKAAVDLVGRAIEVDCSKPDFHYNLGLAHQNLRAHAAAIECYRRTLDLQPKYAPALANLGNLLLLNEAAEEAEACHRKAIALEPENPSHQLRHKPDNAPIHANLGQVFFEQEELEDAEACFRKALSFDPNYTKAKLRLARTRIELDDLDSALGIYEEMLSGDRESARAWAGKAAVLDHMRRTEEAYEIVRRFTQDGPPPPGLIHLYAAMAQKEHRQAEVAEELDGMLAQSGLNRVDRRALHFTLGQLYDRLGAFDDAFKHYEKGNRLRPTPFDPEHNAESFARRMEFFSAERLADLPRDLPRAGNESDHPVFIVGMPRSGSSLVEQILSCHEDVYGAGELRGIWRLAASLVPDFDRKHGEADLPGCLDRTVLSEAAERHLGELRKTAGARFGSPTKCRTTSCIWG
jgi:tetratricopeptide (TPR) repeat protein